MCVFMNYDLIINIFLQLQIKLIIHDIFCSSSLIYFQLFSYKIKNFT